MCPSFLSPSRKCVFSDYVCFCVTEGMNECAPLKPLGWLTGTVTQVQNMCDNGSAGIAEIVCLFVCASVLTPQENRVSTKYFCSSTSITAEQEGCWYHSVNTQLKSNMSGNEASAEHHY